MNKIPLQKALSYWNILLLLVLALLIFLPAVSEYFSSKRDLVNLWHEQGQLLSETVLRSADRIVQFDQQTEIGHRGRLTDFGLYVRTLDSLNYPRSRAVRQFLHREGRMDLFVFDRNGIIQTRGQMPEKRQSIEQFQRIVQNLSVGKNIYFLDDYSTERDKYKGIIVRRSYQRGYLILVPNKHLDKREQQNERHLHTWMDRLTGQPSIEYIVLFRDTTRIAASGPLPPDFQHTAFKKSHWSIRALVDKEVFEYSQIGSSGLEVMIGLTATALNRLQKSLIQRLIFNSILLLLVGSILVIYLIKKQNYTYLQEQYTHIRTYNTSVLENIEEGIIVLNQDRTISVFNPAATKCLSIEKEQAETKLISRINLPLPDQIISSFNNFENLSEVLVSLKQDGKQTDLLITANVASLQEEEEDHQQIYIILLRDNTVQKELQDFRNRRSKLVAMGELASRVAHEIRNPLNGIAVLAQRIQKEFKPRSNTEEFTLMTNSIRGESNRINEIIEAFLTYARSPEMKLQNILVKDWLEGISHLLLAFGNLNIKPLPKPDLHVQIDPDQMQQALVNLLKNALEASSEVVTLSVIHRSESSEVLFQIDDLGTGIDADSGEQIFDLYFTTKETGSGLGLSIVEKIVTAHKGIVRFESPYRVDQHLIQGTRFEIILPLIG